MNRKECTMNLSILDRHQLEAIVLGETGTAACGLGCTEDFALLGLCSDTGARDARLRHVLAAAHELLVRITTEAIVGRCIVDSPELVQCYLRVHFAGAERETFVVIFLDAQLRVIAAEELFAGTLTQTSVHPREVVKRALQHNAAAVICAHPHPSGNCEPSRADEFITRTLQSALALVDVRLVDHFVVSGTQCVAFSQRGLL